MKASYIMDRTLTVQENIDHLKTYLEGLVGKQVTLVGVDENCVHFVWS